MFQTISIFCNYFSSLSSSSNSFEAFLLKFASMCLRICSNFHWNHVIKPFSFSLERMCGTCPSRSTCGRWIAMWVPHFITRSSAFELAFKQVLNLKAMKTFNENLRFSSPFFRRFHHRDLFETLTVYTSLPEIIAVSETTSISSTDASTKVHHFCTVWRDSFLNRFALHKAVERPLFTFCGCQQFNLNAFSPFN